MADVTIDVPRTPRVSDDRRVGVHRDDEVTGLLWYGTHTIFDVPRGRTRTTGGRASDRDIVLQAEEISAHHFVLERRPRGLVVLDDQSTNGIAAEIGRSHLIALRSKFDDRPNANDFELIAGKTFALSTMTGAPYRLMAVDDAMRRHHPALLEILGRENEVLSANPDIETPGPADLLLAADTPSHLLISGPRGCEHGELAKIVHEVSGRRARPFVAISVDDIPEDRRSQSVLLKNRATSGTLALDLGSSSTALDRAFVDQLFSPAYDIRVIVIGRTARQVSDAMGDRYVRMLLHVELAPMARRRSAIYRLLDLWLQRRNSILRMEHLTDANLEALLHNEWRGNLTALREVAVKLDAIATAGFSRQRAAEALKITRQGLDYWYNDSMRFDSELVSLDIKRALIAKLAERSSPTK